MSGLVYLLLGIASSAAVTLVLKGVGSGLGNRYGVLLGNYLTCVCLAALRAFRIAVPLTAGTVVCGIIGGFLFVAGLVMMQKSIAVNGASLTGAFSKLGLLVPLALSAAVFHERVTAVRMIGIVLAVIAAVVINSEPDMHVSSQKVSTLLLLGAMLGCGSGDAMAKIFGEVGEHAQEPYYFLILFVSASLITWLLSYQEMTATGLPVQYRDLLSGVLVGIPNYFSAFLLLGALNQLPALLVYPVYSAGSLLLIVLLSALLFKERPGRQAQIGIVLILAALVLLNL